MRLSQKTSTVLESAFLGISLCLLIGGLVLKGIFGAPYDLHAEAAAFGAAYCMGTHLIDAFLFKRTMHLGAGIIEYKDGLHRVSRFGVFIIGVFLCVWAARNLFLS